MDSTTITDLSQSFLQSDSSLPEKAKSKEKGLQRLTNKLHKFLYWSWYPEGEDTERYEMKKAGMYYCSHERFLHFDMPIELEAYYILLIEVMFKEKPSTFSKEQLRLYYAPRWNQKLLELYYSCTESDLIKIAFLATHPLASIERRLNIEIFIAENLRIIFAKNSPHIDLYSFATQNWKSNPFLAEIERPGYIEEKIKSTTIYRSTQCLTKRFFNSESEFKMFDGWKTKEADIILQMVFKVFLKENRYCLRGYFTEGVVEQMRNAITSFDVFSLSESDYAYLKSSLFTSPKERVVFRVPSFAFLQSYIDFVINVRTVLPNHYTKTC